jgi:hypothetical protein
VSLHREENNKNNKAQGDSNIIQQTETKPDLQLDRLLVQLNGFHFEVDTNCSNERSSKRIIDITKKKTGFPHILQKREEAT